MPPVLRFAPSPTGRLHLGNIRTALVNWLYARAAGGELVLRIDDTDRERSRPDYAAAIEADLTWLGLDWDRFLRQSDRLDAYAEAAERLRAGGFLYPSFESAEELELKRKLALARGRPPIYDRAALALTAEEIAARLAAGERPAWRFKLGSRPVAWDDLVRGPVRFEAGHASDPVLVRPDGQPVYMLASVVDDIACGITHIVRGEDHVANTAVQIEIFAALGAHPPDFAHFALISDAAGEKLSKRHGASSIEELRESGIEPAAILSLLATLGTSDPVALRPGRERLIEGFDLAKFGRSRPRLDEAELFHLNRQYLHGLDYEAVRDRLPAGAGPEFWSAVRGNLDRVADALAWWRVVEGPFEPAAQPDEAEFLAAAAACLPPAPLGPESWHDWTEALKALTGRKGKALFRPLRLALTGLEHGPELARLLPLIGRERALARLHA